MEPPLIYILLENFFFLFRFCFFFVVFCSCIVVIVYNVVSIYTFLSFRCPPTSSSSSSSYSSSSLSCLFTLSLYLFLLLLGSFILTLTFASPFFWSRSLFLRPDSSDFNSTPPAFNLFSAQYIYIHVSKLISVQYTLNYRNSNY